MVKENIMKPIARLSLAAVLAAAFPLLVLAATFQAPGETVQMPKRNDKRHASHNGRIAVSFRQLRRTVGQLLRAKNATAKYQDVRVAEAEGYQPIGPDVPGMGIHFVEPSRAERFDLDRPPILLYEGDPKAPGGYHLVGVSYILDAPAGRDGQPVGSPFPNSLAEWHKHKNVCVLPDRSVTLEETEAQCNSRKGEFIPETPWMVHAWIWKDSPTGVFSSTNPTVK